VLSLKSQERYDLTTVAAIRIRKADILHRKTNFAKTSEVHQKIVQSIDSLTFDYTEAIKYVATLSDADAKSHRKNVIGLFIAGETEWATDKQGRNYTLMVSVPRDIRRFFSYDNQPLWVVDISSSQPLLHALLYPNESDEKEKYLSIVEDGRFWDFMNDQNGGTVDLTDPDERSEFKVRIFREVFFSYPKSKKGKPRTFASIFEREFPILWSEMDATKMKSGPKQSGPLAKAMQQTEAEAVADAVSSLKDRPYPLITIHDAIVTTEDGVADVRQSIKASFATVGLNPPLSVKRLTVS
jgi:flagellar biosynthesis regulator FlaF